MDILIRNLELEELEKAVAVETAAMKGNCYLRDVADEFFSDKEGVMLGAYCDGVLAGIAKYTVLPDHTAWLETLRVHPDYQRKGVGRKFYEVFQAYSVEKQIPSMAMYTGLKNIPSYSLARLFGLDTAGKYREFQLDLASCTHVGADGGFELVGPEEACELLPGISGQFENFLIFNRTFMHANNEIFKAMAAEGKVLADRDRTTLMVFGNRFLKKRTVQIAMMAGDYKKCLDHAVFAGRSKGVPQVVAMTALADEGLQKTLEDYGFFAAADLQVMSGPVSF